MGKTIITTTLFLCLILNSCAGENDTMLSNIPPGNPPSASATTYKYLALGDSYTVGESVCETCRFPEQLKARIQNSIFNTIVNLNVIAQTGWTTTNLINAVNSQSPTNDYDLVTLLIGVNNQFQHKPFSLYESEFPQLIDKAIALAKGDSANIIVVSIPDYRYTPYGNGLSNPKNISAEIDQYNAFASNYCNQRDVKFIDITDITRQGIDNPDLVASDGLHPSQFAYAQFVDRILPEAVTVLSQ